MNFIEIVKRSNYVLIPGYVFTRHKCTFIYELVQCDGNLHVFQVTEFYTYICWKTTQTCGHYYLIVHSLYVYKS